MTKKTNEKISNCQTSKYEFCRWINRAYFSKSNQEQGIAQSCSDGKKNVYSYKKYVGITDVPLKVLFAIDVESHRFSALLKKNFQVNKRWAPYASRLKQNLQGQNN